MIHIPKLFKMRLSTFFTNVFIQMLKKEDMS